MLQKVKRPDGNEVSFEYDALGRRISKIGNKKITRYIWDGNVLLHEWSYDVEEEPKTFVDDEGNIAVEKESVENVVTWVYGGNGFTPVAKLINGKKYSIISDYLGTPVQSFDAEGNLVWEREIDIYGNIKKEIGDIKFVPFKYQGQYFDEETELCYNRFRYYNYESGKYISKDPIGLAGGITLYNYVENSNYWLDPFGLMPWGEFMNGASATITSGGNTGTYHSSTAGHAEINGLNDFANKGWLHGQDVNISNVTGHFNLGDKPVGVCSKCRSDIFGILAENGAKSVTVPVTKGNVQIGEYKINSENFMRIQAEIDKINSGTGTARNKSDAAWDVLKKYNYK